MVRKSDRLGYRMAGRPENVGRPKTQMGPDVDSHWTTGRCEKCDPQSSVQDMDVRPESDIHKNASDVKVSDVRGFRTSVKMFLLWECRTSGSVRTSGQSGRTRRP